MTTKTDGISWSDSYYNVPTLDTFSTLNSGEYITITQTYYSYEFEKQHFINEEFYNLNFTPTYMEDGMMLASRCVNAYDGGQYGIFFGINTIIRGVLSNNNTHAEGCCEGYIRPVITVGTDVILTGGDGSEEKTYQLMKIN